MSQLSHTPKFKWSFLHPRYWHTWIGIGCMYLLSWLPYKVQRFLGFQLGLLIMKVLKKRKFIAKRNLELCFPTMSDVDREKMLIENFKNSGFAFFETCMAWFWPNWRLKKHVSYKGFEQIEHLKNTKKGVLLIAVHSLNLELGARAFGLIQTGFGVYRPNSNPVYDWFQYRGRSRDNYLIDRRDVKRMIKSLRQGEFIWYAPDHDYGKHRYTWAPLFAVEKACTTTGTHLLASVSKANVAAFTVTRDAKGTGYTLTLHPVMQDFPYDDEVQAAIYINKHIEKSIMLAPDQYMWLHRRFKSRPEGEASLYD